MYRIIPCLDILNNKVVKGVKFKDHEILGDVLDFALKYERDGADELVFYDISASSDKRIIDYKWIEEIAKTIKIPFCVAGGINNLESAEKILNSGATKISLNSPAIEKPQLIKNLNKKFGGEKIVIGIDSYEDNNEYYVYQYTGSLEKVKNTGLKTKSWLAEVEQLGAGEIVLNCMNQDGVRRGYDIKQLKIMSELINIPLIASGGAGRKEDFKEVFKETKVKGALAASIFHKNILSVKELKHYLNQA